MSLKTFFVQYTNGARQIIHSDLQSIEQFCNQHFGTAWEDAKAFGAHIAMTAHNLEANLIDEVYQHHFAPEPAPSSGPAPEELAAAEAERVRLADEAAQALKTQQEAASPAPSPAPAPAPAPAPTGEPAAAPSTGEQPSQPTGDVIVGLTGAEATSETGGTQ